MFRLCIILTAVLLPIAVLGAPTVHLQDYARETSTADDYNAAQPDSESSQSNVKPQVVEPTWITVTMPPTSYTPTGTDPKPHTMQPYTSYVVVPPVQQPMAGSWPSYYPNMPVLPYGYPYPHPYPYPQPYSHNHLCNQQTSPYRVI
ncbi:uncharacterized protein LOC125761923 [Anopheles funestus]|uniref:uncharacterized protein LOC125761923 n=1 Tax=Anopheles funestus TaxID=62324 RepID=UPI0020C6BFAD|nr:uncharacterized protein LOC125761923 [Anopheles funestus]